MIFHGYTDERHTIVDLFYIPGLGFNLYSLHVIQRTYVVISHTSGTHIIRTGLTFSHIRDDSCVPMTRLLGRSVNEGLREQYVGQLRRPVPSLPQVPSSSAFMPDL